MLGIRRGGLAAVGLTTLLVGGLAACSSGDDDDFAEPQGVATTAPGDEAAAAGASDDSGGEGGGDGSEAGGDGSLTGTWEGTYECAAGPTGLTLTIDDRGDGVVAANFAYHPTDANPGAPSGRYSMEGALQGEQLSLTGFRWIEQGGDAPMAGLEASVTDPGTDTIEGTVVAEGCTTFSVARASADPWYVGTYSGQYGCSQGMTGITLTIEDAGDGQLSATYDFYAVPENPSVPSGSYKMEGEYVDGDMALHGVEWVDRPSGYVMVDLEFWSQDGVDPQRLFGTVTGGGCSLFNLYRDASEPG